MYAVFNEMKNRNRDFKSVMKISFMCRMAHIKRDVHARDIPTEEKLLQAIFSENKEERYFCRLCKKWHTK